MSRRENYQNVIKLQLNKPKNWNWELSTLNTPQNIPLPIIELYDNKKNLLAQTNSPYDRKSWNGFPKRTSSYNKLNTSDRIKIREFLLTKSNSDKKLNPISNNQRIDNYIPNHIKTEDVKHQNEDILNNNTPNQKFENAAILLPSSNVNSFKNQLKKSNTFNGPIKNYKLQRSFKRTSLKDIPTILEENSFNNNNNIFLNSDKCSRESLDRNNSASYKNRSKYINGNENCAVLCKQNIQDTKNISPNVGNKNSSFSDNSSLKEVKYELVTSKAGTLLVHVDSLKTSHKKARRRRRSQLRNVPSSSSDEENMPVLRNSRSSKSRSVSSVDSKLNYKDVNSKYSGDSSRGASIRMGANFSRHSSKGMSGRKCQSISNICNSKDHYNTDNREIDAAYKFCNSLPSPNGTVCNNNIEHKPVQKQKSLPNKEQLNEPGHPHSECHPLQWKFTEGQHLCDQGYGSERSPEEEAPPPLPSHQDVISETCESPYPFITAENTFEIELTKGSRGLGLSVCGGIDSDSPYPGLLRIKRLFPHQPAATCGLLQVGDLILEANGNSLSGLSNCEALEVLRMTPHKVVLLVCRPPSDILSTMSPVSDVPPPVPRRSTSPSHLSLKTPTEDMYDIKFEVVLTKIQGSLGFTLYKDELGVSGHYIRALVREPAISDGRIQPGDKILQVNGTDISSLTHEEAVQFLRQCGREVHLTLLREADRTPTTDLSPTETTPNSSFRPKINLRQEAVDMLTDLAARKLNNESPPMCASPKHRSHGYDVTDSAQYVDNESEYDDEKSLRPCYLEIYNPNQTPVAVRKSKFNLTLAHNAYELNNLNPEHLDAPKYDIASTDSEVPLQEDPYVYPEEPQSMPTHLGYDNINFQHKKPTYQSQQFQDSTKNNSTSFNSDKKDYKGQDEYVYSEEPQSMPHLSYDYDKPNFQHKKPVYQSQQYQDIGKNSSLVTFEKSKAERDLLENDAQILNIELTRGWNSRLGFSLQDIDGCTVVSAVYPDSVAAKDGRIKAGDCLLRVNDEMVEHMKTSDVIDLLRIVRGPVCITVLRRKIRLD